MTNQDQDTLAPNQIIDVITSTDGISAIDSHGNKYKIQSIMLGVGAKRKSVEYSKGALIPKTECRAEILPNGKLNIL